MINIYKKIKLNFDKDLCATAAPGQMVDIPLSQ